MAKTVTLTQTQIQQVMLDVAQQSITVSYTLNDAAGQPYQGGTLVYWVTVPQTTGMDGKPQPQPSNWYALPAGMNTGYAQLVAWIKTQVAAQLT